MYNSDVQRYVFNRLFFTSISNNDQTKQFTVIYKTKNNINTILFKRFTNSMRYFIKRSHFKHEKLNVFD